MISVIITTYNRLEMLKRAVKSVLDQSYEDFELIIVDDASTDGTIDYIKSLKDKRIKSVLRNKNFGNDTRPKNQGAKKAKGEYLAYLDDDNAYRPDHLQALYNAIIKDPRIDVVYGDRIIKFEDDKPAKMGHTSDFSDTKLMSENFIDTSDVLMKREALFDVGGWDERWKKYVDWNLWLRMTKAGKQFKRVPVVITEYYIHDGAKSVKVKTKGDKEGMNVPEWDAVNLVVEQPYLKKLKEPKIAVYSLTYDRLDYTKGSFASLNKTAGYQFDHFVVDNGSKDGTVKWLKKNIDKDKLILNDENAGISKASNQIVDLIGDEYDIIMKWDNDAFALNEGWLNAMVEIWKSNHMLALSPYVSGLKDNPGGAPRVAYGHVRDELVGITKHLGGICVFTDARAYKEFRWDEDSFLHGVQDMEFSQYLLFNGFRLMYLENYQISHGKQGTEKQYEDYPEYFERRKKEKTTRYEENGK